MTSFLIRDRREDLVKMEEEIGVIQSQTKKKLEEARKASPLKPQREHGPTDTSISDFRSPEL